MNGPAYPLAPVKDNLTGQFLHVGQDGLTFWDMAYLSAMQTLLQYPGRLRDKGEGSLADRIARQAGMMADAMTKARK